VYTELHMFLLLLLAHAIHEATELTILDLEYNWIMNEFLLHLGYVLVL